MTRKKTTVFAYFIAIFFSPALFAFTGPIDPRPRLLPTQSLVTDFFANEPTDDKTRVDDSAGGNLSAQYRVAPAPTAPDAPVIGTVTARNQLAVVRFTPPANNGGSAITRYTVISNPAGGVDAGGTRLSRIITGLTNGIAYTFTMTATNSIGTGAASAASNSATPFVPPPYFLSPSGSDSNSGLAGSPWASFARAWTVLLPGDVLEVADGSYSNASPPAGKAGIANNEITVQATNPGGAQITSALNLVGNSYISFIGLRITGTNTAVLLVSNGVGAPTHHVTFQQIGFNCTTGAGPINDNSCFGLRDGTHHVLLEDSWGWGGGRYTVLCYGGPGGSPPNLTCDNNTFRRVVLRKDPSTSSPGNPQASMTFYYASGNIVENVIALDGQAASDTDNSAFYVTSHTPPPNANANKFYGIMALNNRGTGFYISTDAIASGNEVYNSVFWGSTQDAAAIYGTVGLNCVSTIFDHNTMAFAGNARRGLSHNTCASTQMTNNAFYRNTGVGALLGSGSIAINNNNGYFGNTLGARSGIAGGTGGRTDNPQYTHITRIEAASTYHNAGSSGDIGANVVNRYQDGTLTGTPLWPWPNEARLRAEMCAVVTGSFCSSGKTLTRYIWEYLGNTIPAGIYP